MRSVDDQLRRLVDIIAPLPPIELRVVDAEGCRLAEDVVAANPVPPYDEAAHDGYAVRTTDVASASGYLPVTLHVVGDVRVGEPPTVTVQPGLCARIAGGAPLPTGADAVVPAVWTDGGLAQVRVTRALAAWHGVRRGGSDVPAGTAVLTRGVPLDATAIGLLAALGRRSVSVHPRPRLVVLASGSELVDAGEPVPVGRAADATGPLIAAAARATGATVFRAPVQPDDARQLTEAVEDALIQADILVTTGGVRPAGSGAMRTALGRMGEISVDEIAMLPPASLGCGLLGLDKVPVIALSGGLVGAFMAFHAFIRPALRQLGAADPSAEREVMAILRGDLPAAVPGHRRYVPVRLEPGSTGWTATPTATELPTLASIVRATGVAVISEDVGEVAAGTLVPVWPLGRTR